MSFQYDPLNYNTKSAEEVVPLVMDILNPKTIADIGCGNGTWLSVFKKHGISEVVGIDGNDIPSDRLYILADEYLKHDLANPIILDKKFDLVISLEVAEHIPEGSADVFIKNLVNLGDVILFSAAVPGQGGDNHLNEQFPDYWQEKFLKHDFFFHDIIREKIWNDPKVEWWYRQNMYVVINKKRDIYTNKKNLSVIHPEMFKYHFDRLNNSLLSAEKELQNHVDGTIGVKASWEILKKAVSRKIFSNG